MLAELRERLKKGEKMDEPPGRGLRHRPARRWTDRWASATFFDPKPQVRPDGACRPPVEAMYRGPQGRGWTPCPPAPPTGRVQRLRPPRCRAGISSTSPIEVYNAVPRGLQGKPAALPGPALRCPAHRRHGALPGQDLGNEDGRRQDHPSPPLACYPGGHRAPQGPTW